MPRVLIWTVVIQHWHFKVILTGDAAMISFCLLLMGISTRIASPIGDPTMCPQLISSSSVFMRVVLSMSELLRRRGNSFSTVIIGAPADSIYLSSTATFFSCSVFFPILVSLNLFALSKLKLAKLTIF